MPSALPCLVLTGPTAVGKTQLLRDIPGAIGMPIEVINADAFQVFRGLNIGTAKPDKKFCALIPHHNIDILDPNQIYNVGDFCRSVYDLIPVIRARGALPVVCGGSIFYLKHLIFGLPKSPPTDPEVRRLIAIELEAAGLESAYQKLKDLDPVSGARIHPNDAYRITRALEVYQLSGQPLSAFVRQGKRAEEQFKLVCLERPRSELVDLIGQRVNSMFDQGLVREVEALVQKGYGPQDPGMKAIGYQEFFEDDKGPLGRMNPESLRQIQTQVFVHTCQYAKRQMTFVRSLEGVHFMAAQEKDATLEKIRILVQERD